MWRPWWANFPISTIPPGWTRSSIFALPPRSSIVLTNAETSISSAERNIMELHARLYPSDEHFKAVFPRVLEEFDFAEYMLKEVLGRRFSDAPAPVFDDASDSRRCAPCSSYEAGDTAPTTARSSCCE